MDEYRRRPPLGEGYLRNKRGGEAFEDDSVEGHSMPANPNLRANPDDDDDTQGHGALPGARDYGVKSTPGGEAQAYPRPATPEDDDTEGHGGLIGAKDSWYKAQDEDDTEGHGARDLK